MVRTKPRYLSTGSLPFVLVRRSLGTTVAGRYVPGTTTEVSIKANIQPLPRSTLLKLNVNGDTTSAAFAVFSNDLLRMQVEGYWESDIMTINGLTYEFVEVVGYGMGVLDHYEAIALRKELS